MTSAPRSTASCSCPGVGRTIANAARRGFPTEIALELYDRPVAHGVHFEWLTFDEWYGTEPVSLRSLDDRG